MKIKSGLNELIVKVNEGFKPNIELAYSMVDLSDGGYSIIDRTSQEDFYSCDITFGGRENTIDQIETFLQTARVSNDAVIELSEFNSGETIFGENVDYSGTIIASVVDIGKRRNVQTRSFNLPVSFVALTSSLSFIPYIGEMPVLGCLFSKYTAESSWTYLSHISYNGTVRITDRLNDKGSFEGRYRVSNQLMRDLREFYRNQRGEPFEVTESILGIPKPFGSRAGNYPYSVHIFDMKEKIFSPSFYEVEIGLVQA